MLYGADGNDTIDGGDETLSTPGDAADVILGDNGVIYRHATSSSAAAWSTYTGAFSGIAIRDVVRFDNIDRVSGNDTISGDDGQDIIFGQRGDDTLFGDAGDDEIIGGLGNDTIHGGDGRDFLLGDEGQIVRTFNPDGTPKLNSDGSWHRDILLEDYGTITGTMEIGTAGLTSAQMNLADKVFGADLVIAGGAYDAAGHKLLTSSGAWRTSLTFIDLVSANNDTIDGGDGTDVIIGQRGDDSLAGGSGDDLVVGDNMTDTLPYDLDLPKVESALRLFSTEHRPDGTALTAPDGDVVSPNSPFVLTDNGLVIRPALTLMPEELNSSTAAFTVDLNEVPTLSSLLTASLTQAATGVKISPFLAFVPDIVHHADALPGNDRINVDAAGLAIADPGNDMIFGDNAIFVAPLSTGLTTIEQAVTQNTNELAGMLKAFHFAGLDYANYQGGAAPATTISVGNDIINAGTGDDTVFGDDGRVIVASLVGLPVPVAQLKQTALDYYSFLRDFQEVTVDVEYAGLETHAQLLTGLVAQAKANGVAVPRTGPISVPHQYNLIIGNDTITGGDGGDLIIGDAGTILSPFLANSAINNGGKDIATVDKVILRGVQSALANAADVRNKALTAHIKVDETANSVKYRFPKAEDMRLLAFDLEHSLSIGNDNISGNAGEDVIVGDLGVIYVPTLLASANTGRTPGAIEADFTRLTSSLGGYLGNPTPSVNRSSYSSVARTAYDGRGRSARISTLNSGNDTISGGDGNDVIATDYTVIATPYIAREAATQVGSSTAKLDLKNLIRTFGQPLPGQNLGRDLFVTTSNTNQRRTSLGAGAQGLDTADGGAGNDLLFGGRTDLLTDTVGLNYVDTDPKQRQTPALKSGTNYQLGVTIRQFLKTLSTSSLSQTTGKDGRVVARVRDLTAATVVLSDPTAGGAAPATPVHTWFTDVTPAAIPPSVAPTLVDTPTGTTSSPSSSGWFAALLRRLRG